jgi:glycosyltransferase involved in cell wall biosynthesis
MPWHLLDVRSVWIKEFASALSRYSPVVNWLPVMSWTGVFETREAEMMHIDPPLQIRCFPLQRGYSRFPISLAVNLGEIQAKRMKRLSPKPQEDPLVCTTPYYASVAEHWPGPVIYYQTDLTFAYAGADPKLVKSLDRRMCQAAQVVCPNSRRVGQYLADVARCNRAKIQVIPNATRLSNVLPGPDSEPGVAPQDLQDLRRPLVGVIGNLAANLNWCLLEDAVKRTARFNWVFVGPTDMDVPEEDQRRARQRLMESAGPVRFVGNKPYGVLQQYARAFDVAVLPYRRKEPTFSGSSTRFYEHLAACRPMIATKGFEELLRKEPLLRLVDDAEQLADNLEALARMEFVDGQEEARWQASRKGTWDYRARTMIESLRVRGLYHGPSLSNESNFQPVDLISEMDKVDQNGFELVVPD